MGKGRRGPGGAAACSRWRAARDPIGIEQRSAGGGQEEFWIGGSGIWNEEEGERWLGESGRGDPEGGFGGVAAAWGWMGHCS